jgi:uncharacterized protein (TIGR01777 family)
MVLFAFCIQCVLGAFDNLWHHEIQARLPRNPSARKELALHCARELLYAAIFAGIAWRRWQGLWGGLLVALLAAEIAVTICDFVEEDRTRRLPPLERVLHTVMALNYGALLALWAPELGRWLGAPAGLPRTSYGALSWAMTAFALGVGLWGLRDLLAVGRLSVPEWQRRPLRAGGKPDPRTILVTGGTGFVGSALVRSLVAGGDRVIVWSRDPRRARDRFGPLVEVTGSLHAIDRQRRIDGIVHLAGEPLAGGPWTAARKRRFLDSRIDTTGEVVELISRLERKPGAFICASAAGIYGDRGEEALDESSTAGSGYLPALTRDCEAAAVPAGTLGVRTCWLRIGYVLGAGGGMLGALIPAVRLGGGAVLGSGRQWLSWIHLRDMVRLIEFALDRPAMSGAVNAVAPSATTQRTFAQALARALHRPVTIRLPERVLKALLGDMASLLLASQIVAPQRALAAGFRFEFDDLDTAMRDITRRNSGKAAMVYANFDCPVCNAEMTHYREASERCGAGIEFVPVRVVRHAARWGLAEADLRRRLFVVGEDGEALSGIEAFRAIWIQLPRLRWLAVVAGLPGIRQLLELLYDLVCAPALTRWSEARKAGVPPHSGRAANLGQRSAR